MGNFPFFRFPYPNYYYRRPYNVNSPTYYNQVTKDNLGYEKNREIEEVIESKEDTSENVRYKNISSKHNYFANINLSNLFSSNLEEPVLEILGIRLYLDDVIILGLLFFLYTEGVQDELLFIALILLLLS